MDFHPLSERFPLMPDGDLGYMVNDLIENGFNDLFPIVTYAGKILDGRNRFRACKTAKIKPIYIDFDGDDDAAEKFVETANAHRRHLERQWIIEHRKARIERVRKAAADGKSQREIAADEGITKTQVVRDLDEGGPTGGTTKNEKETPAPTDNSEKFSPDETEPKKYCRACRVGTPKPNCKACKIVQGGERKPAPSKPKKVCDDCRASGKKKDCKACLALRGADNAKRFEETADPKCEATIEDGIREQNAKLEKWCKSLTAMIDTMPTDPWLDDMNRKGGAAEKIRNAASMVRSAKCKARCPKCDGSGCRLCHNSGRMTDYALKQL